MRRTLGIALIATLLSFVPATASGSARTESRYYSTLLGSATICQATEANGIPAGWGGACFALEPSDDVAKVTITDLSGPPVQGYWSTLDQEGLVVSSGEFCDTGVVQIPESAVTLRVYVDGIADQVLVDLCGVGTAGTLTVDFSS